MALLAAVFIRESVLQADFDTWFCECLAIKVFNY